MRRSRGCSAVTPKLFRCDRVGKRIETGVPLRGREPDQVADQRSVRPLAARMRGDPRQVEEHPFLGRRELELPGGHARRRRDRVAGGPQPFVHGWHAIAMSKAPPYSAAVVDVVRLPGGASERDTVAVEEPLEIRINGEPVAVTMRTPGHDEELALGFCLSEGLAPRAAALPDDLAANTVDVTAAEPVPAAAKRNFYTSSSCGVCGKGALEAVAVEAPRVAGDLQLRAATVSALPERLREAQAAFEATGGLHATGLFANTGELLCVREDVGRHNAMDKVIGWAFRAGRLPLRDAVLCVSGRLSFELVQEAAVAGCPVIVAVGAPSTLAIELAADRGLTLCGFVRDGRINVYTEPWRITA